MKPHSADLLLDLRSELGEGPVWHLHRQRLLSVDIIGRRLIESDVGAGRSSHHVLAPEMIGCAAPRASGGVIAALESGLWVLDEGAGDFMQLAKPREHDPARCRFNDGKCDPQGRFWAGTMSHIGEAGAAALYCFDPDKEPQLALPGVTTSNGLTWSGDGRTLYYIDSRTRRVDTFDFDGDTARLSNRRAVVDITSTGHIPDGCTLDAEGMLWVAHWRGGCVTRWNPKTGRQLARVDVPAPHVSSCTFGGPRLDTLFITTARNGLTPEQLAAFPASGGIFACQPGVVGVAADVYRG